MEQKKCQISRRGLEALPLPRNDLVVGNLDAVAPEQLNGALPGGVAAGGLVVVDHAHEHGLGLPPGGRHQQSRDHLEADLTSLQTEYPAHNQQRK